MHFEKFDKRIINTILTQLTAEVAREKSIHGASRHIAALSLANKKMYAKIHNQKNTNMLISSVTKQFTFSNELCTANYLLKLPGAKMWLNDHMLELGIC